MIMSIFFILIMMLCDQEENLVVYIDKMKKKVVTDKQIQNLCSEIANLSENFKSLVSTNEYNYIFQ